MKKNYRILCTYETVLTTIKFVEAENEEEAKKLGAEKFDKWNEEWIKSSGGNSKKLLKVEILNEELW